MNHDDFVDLMAEQEFGMTRTDAHAKGICISCKQPPKHVSPDDEAEYRLSALCRECFGKIMEGDWEDYAGRISQ